MMFGSATGVSEFNNGKDRLMRPGSRQEVPGLKSAFIEESGDVVEVGV